MWYIGIAALFAWQFISKGKYTPLHTWLHQPLTGSHIAALVAVGIVSFIVATILASKPGDPVPEPAGVAMALAVGFCGFLWYLVQIHKPAPVLARPTPTVTVTASPVVTQTHTLFGMSWEMVAIFGIAAVVVIIVLYFVVRFVL